MDGSNQLIDLSNQSNTIIQNLLNKENNLNLNNNTVFVFGSNQKELTTKNIFDLVICNKFTKMFSILNSDQLAAPQRVHMPNEITPKAFINLLRYIYFNRPIRELTELSETEIAANYYNLDMLRVYLLSFAEEHLTIDNSIVLFNEFMKMPCNLDYQFRLEQIDEIIQLHAEYVVQADKFVDISKATLIKLLQNDKLFIQEKDLYYACIDWIDTELIRQNLEIGSKQFEENRLKLFNEMKHLIRFPLMSKFQFFAAERKYRFKFEEEIYKFNHCPGKSGFFTAEELREFETYFNNKDPNVFSINYRTDERAQMNIGVLCLTRNKEGEIEFKMSTKINDLYRKNEPRHVEFEKLDSTDFIQSNCFLDSETYIEECGDNSLCVYDVNGKRVPTRKVTLSNKRNLICKRRTIRIFKIEVSGISQNWISGEHLQIIEDGKIKTTHYKRYSIDHTIGFYDYYPAFELKLNSLYDFKFTVPGVASESNLFRLENIWTKNQLDIKLTFIGGLAGAFPRRIYFLYK